MVPRVSNINNCKKKVAFKLGIMQGRLVPDENNKVQSFPRKRWKNEFKIANILGFKNIEYTVDFKDIYKNPINSANGRKEIKELMKKYKIVINSLTADFFMQRPFFKKGNYQYFELVKLICNNSKKIGVKYIIIPLVDNSSLKYANKENLFKSFLNLNKILDKNKQKILFELDLNPKQICKFISRYPKKKFGINYDLGNSASLGYKFENEKIYFNRVDNIHLKDRKYKGKTVRFGEGDANFIKLFKYLKKIKYKKNLIFQHARNKYDKKEAILNYNFVKNKIKESGL